MPKARSQKRDENAEQSVGFQLLELYITTCLRDKKYKLELEAKRNLRLCCKKFKAIFDGAITQATWQSAYFHLQSDSQLIEYWLSRPTYTVLLSKINPEPFPLTLDQMCRKFSSIVSLNANSFRDSLGLDRIFHKSTFQTLLGN